MYPYNSVLVAQIQPTGREGIINALLVCTFEKYLHLAAKVMIQEILETFLRKVCVYICLLKQQTHVLESMQMLFGLHYFCLSQITSVSAHTDLYIRRNQHLSKSCLIYKQHALKGKV